MRKVDSIRSNSAHGNADGGTWASEWRTQERISRRRGVGYCVIEVHEFGGENRDAPPRTTYRVYQEIRGFPVGAPLASFPTRQAAQQHAEALGCELPEGMARAKSA